MDEREAIARAKRRDLSGLEALVRQHQQPALRLAGFITRDRQMAEDVVSDCFLKVLKAYERIGQFDSNRPFRPWFLRSVLHAALKAAQRRNRLIPLEQPDGETPDAILTRLTASAPDPAEAAEQAEVRAAVREALAALTPRQRAVLVLRYYDELSESETAAALGIPRGTVKSRLAAGLGRLRVLLSGLRSR
jgi:RNA polymerase sigma-70 factor (ECF subfamily)